MRPDHLNGHIKQVHTTERPHKCQTCNASFATRDRLRSHLACHEEKIPCQVCGKYLRAAYMADHLKKHTEGPTNFCSICNRDDPKCPHQDQHDNSDSFGDLSDGSDLKSPDKLNQNGPYSCEALKSKPDPEAERKYQCPDCGSCFRSKSYLNKHIQKAHLKPMAGPLGDLGPTLGSPFSPQQNMSLLESFGFQIVQSAFASSLADPEMEQGPMSVDDK